MDEATFEENEDNPDFGVCLTGDCECADWQNSMNDATWANCFNNGEDGEGGGARFAVEDRGASSRRRVCPFLRPI